MFPASYVEYQQRRQHGPAAALRMDRRGRRVPARTRKSASASALYDYQATEEGYIGLTANQEIMVTDQADGRLVDGLRGRPANRGRPVPLELRGGGRGAGR